MVLPTVSPAWCWCHLSLQKPLKGAIPDPAPIMMTGQTGSWGRTSREPWASLTQPASWLPISAEANMPEARPTLCLPSLVWYSTTPTIRLSVLSLGEEAIL